MPPLFCQIWERLNSFRILTDHVFPQSLFGSKERWKIFSADPVRPNLFLQNISRGRKSPAKSKSTCFEVIRMKYGQKNPQTDFFRKKLRYQLPILILWSFVLVLTTVQKTHLHFPSPKKILKSRFTPWASAGTRAAATTSTARPGTARGSWPSPSTASSCPPSSPSPSCQTSSSSSCSQRGTWGRPPTWWDKKAYTGYLFFYKKCLCVLINGILENFNGSDFDVFSLQ